MFSLALLVFFLASVIDGQETEEKTPLPPDMKEVFIELNRMYEISLKWDNRLAEKALEESRQRHTLKADAKVMATRTFWKKDQKPTKEMLELTMKDRFAQREERISSLQEDAHYGCDGIFVTDDKYINITATCLYCNPGSLTRDCYIPSWKA